MAEHAMGGDGMALRMPRQSSIQRLHLRFGKGLVAELMTGVIQFDADGAAVDIAGAGPGLTPACQARRSSGTNACTVPSMPTQ
jgi:hypothetical protein